MVFQKTVAIIAGVTLLIALCAVAFLAYHAKNNVNYPPVSAQCPDYWEVQEVNGQSTCVNSKNLGKSSCPSSMNFSVSPWAGDKGLCRKRDWARECDITWDGVTNMDLKC